MAFRAFISVDVGHRIDWSNLRKELVEVDRGVRPVRPEQFHLTLRFLGDTEEDLVDDVTGVMASSVEGVGPFDMDFEGVGAFPNVHRPRVVWIGLLGAEPLSTIASRLERGVVDLGWSSEKRPFRPHATVARVKFLKRRERFSALMDAWAEGSFGTMRVKSIELIMSNLTPQGPIYTTVHTSDLEG